MPKAYKTPEYDHLLLAERTLVADIENKETCAKDRAACARVLVAVLDYKRVLRMKPKPKDLDVSKVQKRQRIVDRPQPAFTPVESSTDEPKAA